MSRLKRCLCFPFTPLLRRVRLPVVGRAVPLWTLVLSAVIVFVPLTGTAIVATNQPIFCKSCHEMDLHYATWSQSAHHNVGCENCHVMPGTLSMFKSKLHALKLVKEHAKGDVRAQAIQGHVPDANCKKCHPQTPELITYHGLKITHKAHWDMGIKCTYCHARVVHGPKWLYTGVTSAERIKTVTAAYTYTPTMETCSTCHDGKRAPDKCSTCHVTLGARFPSAFDAAWVTGHKDEVKRRGLQDCQRCHQQDFCNTCHRFANQHPSDWIARHPQEARKPDANCAACHLAPAERQPKDLAQMAFCQDCHGLRREHKQANWLQVHGQESRSEPQECQRCHQQSWCSDCHSISRPHPQDWLARHSSEANRDPSKCQVCHTQNFCDSCHKTGQAIPASHNNNWLGRHKDVATQPGASCNTCHKPDFCQACHSKKAPASHDSSWLTGHGAAAKQNNTSCTFCHRKSDCAKCHGMVMPHPKDWLSTHPKAAGQNMALCKRCHQEESCTACHRGALPVSHKSSNWLQQHGAQALKRKEQCTLCHRTDFCTSCHGGTQMPHPKDWPAKHGPLAAKDQSSCARCHQQQDCTKCHGLQMPHPADWVTTHGKQAEATPTVCAKCHMKNGKSSCATTCHSAMQPPNHQRSDWKSLHMMAGSKSPDLCTLCHGKDACNTCHAKRKVS